MMKFVPVKLLFISLILKYCVRPSIEVDKNEITELTDALRTSRSKSDTWNLKSIKVNRSRTIKEEGPFTGPAALFRSSSVKNVITEPKEMLSFKSFTPRMRSSFANFYHNIRGKIHSEYQGGKRQGKEPEVVNEKSHDEHKENTTKRRRAAEAKQTKKLEMQYKKDMHGGYIDIEPIVNYDVYIRHSNETKPIRKTILPKKVEPIESKEFKKKIPKTPRSWRISKVFNPRN